jgi:hypothetical protein
VRPSSFASGVIHTAAVESSDYNPLFAIGDIGLQDGDEGKGFPGLTVRIDEHVMLHRNPIL